MKTKIPHVDLSLFTSHLSPLPFILICATALRFYRLDGQSLWSDEGNSAAMVQHSFHEIAQRTAADIHPPFYYCLLKIWVMAWGDSEMGLRSLSALLSILLVYVTYRLGQSLFTPRIGLMAAWLAACSPLQIYYAQEARMYMLLALLSALTVLIAVSPKRHEPMYALAYITITTLGLYTHYAYPLILILANLWFIYPSPATPTLSYSFLISHVSLILYLPWLPTAWQQLTTWPAEKSDLPLTTIITTLTFGLSWPYSPMIAPIMMAVVIALYLLRHKASLVTPILLLWLLLPIALTSLLASPAFLKFLLVATTPWAMGLAVAIVALEFKAIPPHPYPRPMGEGELTPSPIGRGTKGEGYLTRFIQAAILAALITSQSLSLYHYYYDPHFARDNYRGIVHFITAVAQPDDAIILNAEGQQEIFNYYYQTNLTQVYPLPRHRPLDEASTLAELQQIAAMSPQIYAVYWATQQADPSGLIENWLNQHLFKATDQWYGNVRLVTYARPALNQTWQSVNYQWQLPLTLTHYSLVSPSMTPGDILQVALRWQLTTPLTTNLTLFMQVLDEANHLVGQRDATLKTCEVLKTSQGCINPITTTEGIFLEPGTPPGRHRLIMGLYDSQTGQRVSLATGGDFIELSPLKLIAPSIPLPAEAFHWQNAADQALGAITLRGYDLYKLGHRSDPDAPLHPGDPLSVVAYWQLTQPQPSLTSELTLQIVDWDGQATPIQLTLPVAGVNYPPSQWQADEIVRAQYDVFLSNLTPGLYRVQWHWQGQTAVSGAFRVE